MVAQYVCLKISEDSCCPAMHKDQGPADVPGATDIAEAPQLAQAEPTLLQIHIAV